MLSPSISASTPEGANLHPTSSRRRALSYLRNISQNRTSLVATPTESPRASPRTYFQRSISYTEPRARSATPPTNSHTRRRSNSRPDEPSTSNLGPLSNEVTDEAQVNANPATANPANPPRPVSPAIDSLRGADATTTTTEATASDDPASDTMARQRPSSARRHTSSAAQAPATQNDSGSRPRTTRTASSRVTSAASNDTQDTEKQAPLPTIRFFPHQEIRSNGRQSLNFAPVSRTLPSEHAIIRVGRYSEREGIPNANPTSPSDAPVGFKSKVVSRKHCEFAFIDGQWHIRDVASSSGTFLNHIRLSQPNTESRQFPIKDGDIVQLGIDFRGGEEMIFRCVKIRIECNRSWQKKPNNFNKSRHAQLQMLAKDQTAVTGTTNNNECSICLGSVLPCQSLFVAPCAHVWHYKCIRPLLEGKNSTYPQFQCPNCRAYTDLTADVDIAESDMDEWMQNADSPPAQEPTTTIDAPALEPEAAPGTAAPNGASVVVTPPTHSEESAEDASPQRVQPGLLARRQATKPGSPELQTVNAIDMPSRTSNDVDMNVGPLSEQRTRSETPDIVEQIITGEGPLTPRNNAGPFVFDGSAGRGDSGSGRRVVAIQEVTE